MDVSDAKLVVLFATTVLFLVRGIHGLSAMRQPVAKRYLLATRDIPLWIAKIGFAIPILWSAFPLFESINYKPLLPQVIVGVALYLVAFWLFHRSHSDLGNNWSQTLEVKQDHSLVTGGIYRRIRHPMYLAYLLYGVGQAFVATNYLVGPSLLVGAVILFVFRFRVEERMMVKEFGDEYKSYCERSKRLIPGVW